MISNLVRSGRLIKPKLPSRFFSLPPCTPRSRPCYLPLSLPLRPLRLQWARNATTAANPIRQKPVQASSFAQRGRISNKYPERLLIFHSPTAVTAVTGVSKLSTILFFGVFGCMIAAPNVYYNPEMPLWMTPAVVVVGALPMVLVSFMTAPFVAGVYLRLPEFARKSKDALHTFLRRLPPDTRLDFQKMGFLPLPRTRTLQLSELRPLSSRLLLANLEHVPHANKGVEPPLWLRIVRGYHWTRPTASHWEKTLVPDAWPIVMEHVKKNAVTTGASKEGSISRTVQGRHLPTPARAMPQAQSSRDTK